jgi:predicted TIM-barrel fold metal-dependent hydrolase
MTRSLDWMISVDDHVLEPPSVWESRLPAKYREFGPRLVNDDKGEAWYYENKRIPTTGLAAAAGKKKEEFSPLPMTYADMRAGCYDSVARLEDMNRDGVLASLCFPSFPRFCGQTFYEGQDKELGLLCVRAYNDWMIEEWAGTAPGRFIPMILIPLWDPKMAAKEIERTAANGAKAIAFSENPTPLGLPSIHSADGYWEPVFAAAADAGMPICTHLGSSSNLPKTSPDAPLIGTLAMQPINIALTCLDWLFSGIFTRHENLKLCLSEGGIGWIPYVLERADYVAERQRWAASSDFDVAMLTGGGGGGGPKKANLDLSVQPSELFRKHVYGCFIDEPHGAQDIEYIGVDNVMIETDYPHTDSSWPNSLLTARKGLAHLSEDDQYKVMRGNAERVFRFTPTESAVGADGK